MCRMDCKERSETSQDAVAEVQAKIERLQIKS
jgi:hypothetical protein